MHIKPPGTFAVQKGRSPTDESQLVEFKIEAAKIRHFHKYGPDDVFGNIELIPYALTSPCAIFKGIDREGYEDSLCYVARTEVRFLRENASVPCEPHLLFLVFTSATFEILSWRFDRCDQVTLHMPVGYRTRFKTQLWPATSL